jgi:hypothetical protein
LKNFQIFIQKNNEFRVNGVIETVLGNFKKSEKFKLIFKKESLFNNKALIGMNGKEWNKCARKFNSNSFEKILILISSQILILIFETHNILMANILLKANFSKNNSNCAGKRILEEISFVIKDLFQKVVDNFLFHIKYNRLISRFYISEKVIKNIFFLNM